MEKSMNLNLDPKLLSQLAYLWSKIRSEHAKDISVGCSTLQRLGYVAVEMPSFCNWKSMYPKKFVPCYWFVHQRKSLTEISMRSPVIYRKQKLPLARGCWMMEAATNHALHFGVQYNKISKGRNQIFWTNRTSKILR